MEDQNIQQPVAQETVPQSHKKFLYAAVGFSLVAVFLLALVLVKIIQTNNQPAVSQVTGQNPAAKTNGASQESLAGQAATTPVPINDNRDIDSALQQIDSMNPSVVETDLNQNTADASQFSQ